MTVKIQPEDKKFWLDEPEPGFSPERNEAVVNNTIKKYEKKQLEKRKEAWDGIRERAHAISYWLTSRHGALSSKPLDKYFGRKYLAKLRGEDIIKRIRVRQNPHANMELRNKIITGKGIKRIHGNKRKKEDEV